MVTSEKNYAISFVRAIAMCFIVICHIMQYNNLESAWWFNVGVQIFFIVSGYLYSNKKIDDIKSFYKKSFLKIIVPYYIYFIIITFVYFIFQNQYLNLNLIIKYLTMSGWYLGVGHMWFIPYILICYFLLPIFLSYFDNVEKESNLFFLVQTAVMMGLIEIISYVFFRDINGSYINCFLIGIFLYRLKGRCKLNKVITTSTIFLTIILNLLKIYINYFSLINLNGILYNIYMKYCNYTHLFLGTSLFIFLYHIYDIKLKSRKLLIKLLDWSDKYSFYVYITHHIYILGFFSIYNLDMPFIVSTLIIIVLMIITSYILSFISNKALKNIKSI